jgi:uncharacterized protein (DUF488 family)
MKRLKARGSIYTVGYDHMSPKRLIEVLDALDVVLLIDCRSKPWSRIPGFDKATLMRSLGTRYEWRGRELGGLGDGPQAAAIEVLAASARAKSRNVALLCKEEAPAACHRHSDIAVPLLKKHGIDCVHVFQDELVLASELERALQTNSDRYAYIPAPWSR